MSTWAKQKFGDIAVMKYGTMPLKEKVGFGDYEIFSGYRYNDKYPETNCEKGDVIIVARGVGGTGDIKIAKSNCYLTNLAIKISLDQTIVNNKYFYYKYLLKNLRYLDSGSAQSQITISNLEQLEVEIPDLPTQSRIASVLSAYDDLIDNNEKRIKALEEMAQLLYTEWFVKFKFPGHEKVKMVESGTEYGKIPEGWAVGPISKLAGFINGYPFKPKDLSEQGLPIIKIPELRSGVLEKTPRNSGTGINPKYIIQTGDILFSWSATLLVNIWNSGNALLNQHLFKVTPKENYYKAYTFYTLVKLVNKIRKHVVGATMQHLRKDSVESAKVLLPNETALKTYELVASKVLKEISLLYQCNQNLLKTRDILIPQLVTGKREVRS